MTLYPPQRGLRGRVLSLCTALTRLFSVQLRDPRVQFPNYLGPSIFSVFFRLFWEWLFWGFCGQHGLNMGPSWGPRGLQNREKSIKKGITSCMLFLIDFLLILGASWVDFWWILNAKLKAKLTKKSITWPLVGKLAEIAKMLQNYCFFQYFWLPRPSNFEAKFNKKRTQTDQNSSKNLVSILTQVSMDFGSQLGSKTLPEPPKSMKNTWKMHFQIS